MSYALKQAKFANQGDPGLFSAIGSVVKKVGGAVYNTLVPSPIKTGVGVVSSIVGGRGSAPQLPQLPPPGARNFPAPQLPPRGGAMPGPMAQVPATVGGPGGTAMVDTKPAIACPQGYHPNKSGYYRRSPAGSVLYIPPGHACVKNRRRNPLNPRAMDRAIGRLSSAKKAAKKLGRITIRESCG